MVPTLINGRFYVSIRALIGASLMVYLSSCSGSTDSGRTLGTGSLDGRSPSSSNVRSSSDVLETSDANPQKSNPPQSTDSIDNGGDSINVPDHTSLTSNCEGCHAKDRPAAVGEKTHYNEQPCELCHKFDGEGKWLGGKFAFAHDPKPEDCGVCHERPTTAYARAYPTQGPPLNFDAANANFLGSGHLIGINCVKCHQTPKEGAAGFGWDHSSVNPGICLPCHFNDGNAEHGTANLGTFQVQGTGNCNSCHKNFDKANTRNFTPI